MKNNQIAILGGCGQVGSLLAEILLKNYDCEIVIVDIRDKDAAKLVSSFKESGITKPVKSVYADTGDLASLQKAFKGSKIVVSAISTVAYHDNIAAACLLEGCDYFDTLDLSSTVIALKIIDDKLVKSKRLFITQGGIAPGLPGIMVRAAANYFDELDEVRLGLLLSLKTTRRAEQLYDTFDFIVNNKSLTYDGKWRKISPFKNMIINDYGERFGKVYSMPILMAEIVELAEKLKINKMTQYCGVTNKSQYMFLMRLLRFLHKLKPELGWKTLSKFILPTMKNDKNDPGGYAQTLDAWGIKDGKRSKLRILIDHDDNYSSTAMIVSLFLRDYLLGKYKNKYGFHLMAHFLDPETLLNDIKKMGINVSYFTEE